MFWTVNDSELTDAYFQRCLYLGVFPTAPFPNNNHYLRPSALAHQIFLDYGSLMDALRGKKWVLTPHCVESDVAKVKENDPKPRPCIQPGKPGEMFQTAEGCPHDFAQGNLSWISADQVYLARVKPSPETINDLKAYEFFAGRDAAGQPVWTDRFNRIKPLLEWNNHMGCVTATYVPGLKKYLMCVTDGWPTVAKMTSYILEADAITGPWRMVSYMKDFGEQAYFLNQGSEITICRDGREYARYTLVQPQTFGPDSAVLLGLRHVGAGGDACFAGAIEDARIYDRALSVQMLAGLKAKQPSQPQPLAWWTFEDGKTIDRMGTFPPGRLAGNARIEGGKLHLDGKGSYLICGGPPPPPVPDPVLRSPLHFYPSKRSVGDIMPFFWKGAYHVFHLTNPTGNQDVNWEHIVSTNLVDWEELPPALTPDKTNPTGPEGGCMFTGCVVEKDGTFHAWYTSWITRAALSTRRRAKTKFLSVNHESTGEFGMDWLDWAGWGEGSSQPLADLSEKRCIYESAQNKKSSRIHLD